MTKKGFISLVYKNSWQKRNNKDINLQVRLFHFRLEWYIYRERESCLEMTLYYFTICVVIFENLQFLLMYLLLLLLFLFLGSMICLGESEYYKYNNPDEETLNEEAKKAKCQARMMMMTTTSSLRSASNLAAANNKNLVKRSSSTSTSQKHDYVSNGITRIAVFLLF